MPLATAAWAETFSYQLKRIREKLFEIIFGSGRATRTFEVWLLFAILISVTVAMLESVSGIGPVWLDRLWKAEIVFTSIFTVEYMLRLFCHPRRSRYAFSFFGIVDFIAILPTWLVFIFPGWESLIVLRTLRMFRIVRIFSLQRFSRAAMTIYNALQASRYKIGVFIIGVVLISVVAGSLMYLVEGPENGFSNIPESVYWAIVTMTTVGHATLMPATALGQLLTSVLVIMGYAVIAIPVGVITSEVLAVKKLRDALLAGEETEQCEYKSSAFYSYKNPKTPEKVIFEASVIKPVAGFLNAKGGSLFIGVDDNGAPLGIQKDLELKKWNTEKYVRHITDRISQELGNSAAICIRIKMLLDQGLEICAVEVDRSPDPIWYEKSEKSGKRKVFYVRSNNSTRELNGPALLRYTGKRWD